MTNPGSLSYRKKQLLGIKRFLIECESEIETALYEDLRKPAIEAFITEIGITIAELNYTLKNLSKWMKPTRVTTPLILQPSKSRVYPQPLGLVLIIAPWNYPINLTLVPLIGALAAGNRTVVKPSEMAPATSALLALRLPQYIDNDCIKIIEGDATTTAALLTEKFDHIFFTGSTEVGKRVMVAAAQQLTPVTLELGGKSPCIVDKSANLDVAARRIAWGKFTNAGQTCVAPDYVLVHESIENALLEKLKQTISQFYGEFPETSPDYGRIINARHFQRLKKLLTNAGDVVIGGTFDENSNYFSPTILRNVPLQSPIMQEEIFGPILPLIRYSNIEDIVNFINTRPKPLTINLFTQDSAIKDKIIAETSSGSMCINHAMQQLAVPGLPFGGIGASGMGAYHGKTSFNTFSHYKSVLDKPSWFDLAIFYPPYQEKLKRIFRWFI